MKKFILTALAVATIPAVSTGALAAQSKEKPVSTAAESAGKTSWTGEKASKHATTKEAKKEAKKAARTP